MVDKLTIRPLYENDTFQMGQNSDLNACVGNNGFIDLYTYQCGYYKATRELINSTKIRWENDLLIYPIVYSARHTIELFLKYQLFKLKYINEKARGLEFEEKIIKTHNIDELWADFKNLTAIDARFKPYINNLEEFISDFCEVDNTGETFRYPFDHEGARHLTDLSCINIEIFERRFIKLYDIIEEIGYLTDFLVNEYAQGTVISGLSRQQIKDIALALPAKKDWVNAEFTTKKGEILKKYNISSNTFSKVLTLIQSHREFATFIGLEIPLSEINYADLKEFIALYENYHQDVKIGNYIEIKNYYTNLICQKLNANAIKSLSALFDIGYFQLYSEAYGRIIKEKANKDVLDIVFDELDRRIILDKIKIALQTLGQKTLLKVFE